MKRIVLVVGGLFVVFVSLMWLLASTLGLQPSDLWVLRVGLAIMAAAAAGLYLWYRLKSEKDAAKAAMGAGAEGGQPGAPAEGEVDLLAREASARLAGSALGKGASLSSLPAILFIGPEGAAKTTSILHSGLETELLAGQVYQDSNVAPTRAANFWFARGALLVEAGGRLLANAAEFSRLVKRLRPGALASAMGRGQAAPRAAVVVMPCEEFLKPGAADSLPAASRLLRGALEEIARSYGVHLPVYVLFTKADRIPSFAEWAGALSMDETGQVLGVTLPAGMNQAVGVYAERETARLTEAFNSIYYSLCEKRLSFLGREHDPAKLPGVYEFARELRKLRPAMVQFLVDLGRPSQLTAGPFLRGFYFSGVRAILKQEVVSRPAAPQPSGSLASATQAFQTPFGAPQVVEQSVTRRAPQWLFLSHLFAGVLLGDREAMGASAASARASRLRRAMLAVAAAMAVLYIVAATVSFFGNRSLGNQVVAAARALGTVETAPQQAPPLEALTRLDALRQSVETLSRYEREGPPWRLRWGLYSGHALYPEARKVYFRRFHQLLFGATQARLLNRLQALPATPAPTDEYGPVYDTLKAYLITTSNHDKSTRLFLSPVLMRAWQEGKAVDPERAALVQRQFDFYAEELKASNPFSAENDSLAIERARKYLSQFAGIERVYQFMLAEASRQNPGVNFNQQFPGSARAVINSKEIPGAFTKGGFAFMQNAMKNADRFFAGEQWVLGPYTGAAVDRAQTEQQLRARYTADFLANWRAFLKATTVVRFANLKDAAAKLALLAGNQSPLLAAFWVASQHTAVESPEIKNAFQPVQFVVPPESKDRYIGPSNTPYMNALVGLQAAVEQASAGPAGLNNPALEQVNSQATNAKVITRQVAQNFRIDAEGQVHAMTQKLMEDPILYAESLARAAGPAELNSKGAALCGAFRDLLARYPFSATATRQATLQEVNAVFQPGQGALWTFYDTSLRNLLVKQGAQYVAVPAGGITLNPAFIQFFNRAAAVTDTLYPGGAPAPNLTYTLRVSAPQGLQALTFSVDTQVLTVQRGRQAAMGFHWPGSGSQTVRLLGKFGSGPDITFNEYTGLWAVFQFFGDADRWQSTGNVHRLEWVLRQGRAGTPLRLPDGSALTVQFDLEMPGAAPIFQKGFLSGLSCVARVAQ